MDAFYKFIDEFTRNISAQTLRTIRMGVLLGWAILATICVFYAWAYGFENTPPSGQDVSKATIKEKIQRERNRRNPPRFGSNFGEMVVKNELEPDRRKSSASDYPGHKSPDAGFVKEDPKLPELRKKTEPRVIDNDQDIPVVPNRYERGVKKTGQGDTRGGNPGFEPQPTKKSEPGPRKTQPAKHRPGLINN